MCGKCSLHRILMAFSFFFFFFTQVQMSLPENVTIHSVSDCQFYQENPPTIAVVHRHTTQAAQVSQHTNPTSPLPSPLHRPLLGGQQGHTYAMRSNSHGSFEAHKLGFKHNPAGSIQAQNHSPGNFSPQRKFVPQGHNLASSFRNQHQYNRSTWRRRKRDGVPALNQSRWRNAANRIYMGLHVLLLEAVGNAPALCLNSQVNSCLPLLAGNFQKASHAYFVASVWSKQPSHWTGCTPAKAWVDWRVLDCQTGAFLVCVTTQLVKSCQVFSVHATETSCAIVPKLVY